MGKPIIGIIRKKEIKIIFCGFFAPLRVFC